MIYCTKTHVNTFLPAAFSLAGFSGFSYLPKLTVTMHVSPTRFIRSIFGLLSSLRCLRTYQDIHINPSRLLSLLHERRVGLALFLLPLRCVSDAHRLCPLSVYAVHILFVAWVYSFLLLCDPRPRRSAAHTTILSAESVVSGGYAPLIAKRQLSHLVCIDTILFPLPHSSLPFLAILPFWSRLWHCSTVPYARISLPFLD